MANSAWGTRSGDGSSSRAGFGGAEWTGGVSHRSAIAHNATRPDRALENARGKAEVTLRQAWP